MKFPTQNIDTCRRLAAQLPWNQLSAPKSAKILASKAILLGSDREVVEEILFSTPSAGFIREYPEVFLAAWREVICICQAEVNSYEQADFLGAPDELSFDQDLRLRVVVSNQQANRKTAAARRN